MFDPTDRDLFNEQRQRFDWSLLQNGAVFRYDTRFQLDSACDRLTGLGYLVQRIDAHEWSSVEDMFDAFAEAMGYQRAYGGSTSAFSDVFADVGTFDFGSDPDSTGTVLAIAGFDTLMSLDDRTAHLILDHFAREARLAGLYAHPMLCLIESAADHRLEPVGGYNVLRGSVWDSEPDLPWPFHDTDIVEYVFRIYATDAGAVEYIAALRALLAAALADIGRWQILGPSPASEAAAKLSEEHRPEPLPAGTHLLDVSIGIRGEGDHTTLGDSLVHLLQEVGGLRFDYMFSAFYPAGTESREKAMRRYQALADSPDQ
ncbi:hypothetical protein CJ179_41775 [Rhodococcus sp. ACS1]|nr:hypothetical protein CJ179_41775 [Rhodococcus sp. ACS1]